MIQRFLCWMTFHKSFRTYTILSNGDRIVRCTCCGRLASISGDRQHVEIWG